MKDLPEKLIQHAYRLSNQPIAPNSCFMLCSMSKLVCIQSFIVTRIFVKAPKMQFLFKKIQNLMEKANKKVTKFVLQLESAFCLGKNPKTWQAR